MVQGESRKLLKKKIHMIEADQIPFQTVFAGIQCSLRDPESKISVLYVLEAIPTKRFPPASLWPLRGFRLLTAIKIFEHQEKHVGALCTAHCKPK